MCQGIGLSTSVAGCRLVYPHQQWSQSDSKSDRGKRQKGEQGRVKELEGREPSSIEQNAAPAS